MVVSSSLHTFTAEEKIPRQFEAGESKLLAHSTVYGSNQDKMLNLPPGYRFSPHAKELIMHYLINKILGQQLPVNIIRELDLYNYDPHQLPIREFKYGKPEEAYFFTCLRDSKRQKRRTKSGYWKTSGQDKPILHGKTIVGFRKILVFYEGKTPTGIKSSWAMHEFRVNPMYFSANTLDKTLQSKVETYVVCKIRNKRESVNKHSTSKYSKAKNTNKLATDSALKGMN